MRKAFINREDVTIGTDPELFIVDKETGKYVSALPYIPGTKNEPHKLEKEGHYIQPDGVLFEFNVPPVPLIDGASEMWDNICYVRDSFRDFVPSNLELVCCPSAHYEDSELKDPRASEFGCNVDYNAWNNGKANPKPKGNKTNLRTAGGHIHLGVPGLKMPDVLDLIKCLDICISVPMQFIDTDHNRTQLYGGAGSFRVKTCGKDLVLVETRSPSTCWTASSTLVEWVFQRIEQAIQLFNTEGNLDVYKETVYDAINNSNLKACDKLMEKFKIELPAGYYVDAY